MFDPREEHAYHISKICKWLYMKRRHRIIAQGPENDGVRVLDHCNTRIPKEVVEAYVTQGAG